MAIFKGVNYAKRFSGMLASLLYALSIIVPAALITGILGYYIGKIFDSTRRGKKLKKYMK